MDDLLEQNIFDDDFIVFNNDIPYDSYPLETICVTVAVCLIG